MSTDPMIANGCLRPGATVRFHTGSQYYGADRRRCEYALDDIRLWTYADKRS